MPRSRAARASSASIWSSDGSNRPYRCKIRSPGYVHLAGARLHEQGPHAGRHRRRSSARSISSSGRSTDERAGRQARAAGRRWRPTSTASPSRPRTSAEVERILARYPAERKAQRRAAAAASGPGPARRLAAAGGAGPCRRPARHAAHPGLRGRHLLRHVQHRAGRPDPGAGLHDDALLAVRLGRGGRGLQGARWARHRRDHRRRPVLPARVRVPGRLLQRAGAVDRRRLLRGPRLRQDQGHHRGAEARRAADAGAAERPHGSMPHRRQDDAPGRRMADAMLHDQDRIFTNLYGEQPWGLDAARQRGDWDGTKDLSPRAASGWSTRSRTAACAAAAAPASRPA